MRRKLYLLLGLLFVSVSVIGAPAKNAYAASEYDATVVPAYSWEVTDSSGITHSSTIAQAISNISDSQQKSNCEAVYSKLMQMDYRSYNTLQASRYDTATRAVAYGTDQKPDETQWATEGDIKRAYTRLYNYVGLALIYDNNKVVATDCGDLTNGDSVGITYAMRWDDGFTPIKEYLTQGFEVDYPIGYDGATIASSDIGGQITGSVQCANTNNVISAVHINAQSGLSGNAKITDNGMGGKNYRYYLSEPSSYSVTVLCDGDAFYGPIVDSDYYDWACTWTTPGQNPNLGICAES